MKKRALSWLLALTMLLSLAPQTLPVWASATGETATESKLSANTYSALGLNRSSVNTSSLPEGEQPYGKAEEGNTVATNVINELYVNFNGSIHYGWSILDNLTMQWTGSSDWTSSDNFAGAMGYWRPGQQTVHYGSGSAETGALFATNKTAGTHQGHIISDNINSANKHLVYQYSKSEAFSPNTGKDNYVAELVLDSNSNVSLYIYQVEGGNKRYVRSASVVKDEFAGDKNTVIWNWEYDAMYDIAAGDMDGDGYDEIAVYASNHVYLYKYNGANLTLIDDGNTTPPSNSDWQTKENGKYRKLGTAVVTLAFGDLNQDNKEELVMAQNMGYGADNIALNGEVGIYALNSGNKLEEKQDFSLTTDSGGGYTIRYANVATGDINGDYKDELIIAGYYSGSNSDATCTTASVYYKVVKWNGITYNDSGWKSTDFTKSDLLGRVVNNEKQLIPPVSLTCAATQGVGYAEQVFLSGCLYSVDSSNNLTLLTQISTNREYKKDNGDKANKEEIFVVNVVAGNFNGNRNGQEQIVYAFGMKHDDSDRYWYDIGYINKTTAGETDASNPSGYWYGQEQVMNYESSYNRDSNKSRASLYLSLAAVDCDNDSTLVRYKGQEITWTKPEVLTVLQSAPYFQDLQDTRDYLDQAQTGYGKGTGESGTVTAGGTLKLGTYVSFEQDFSVFGVKIASIQAEAQSTHSFEYGFEEVETTEVTINYSGSAGDDYVVVYAVPYVEYQYETWVPGYEIPKDTTEYTEWKNEYVSDYLTGKDANWASELSDQQRQDKIDATATELGLTAGRKVAGSWQPSTVSVPMTPQTVLLSVDAYDEIAEQTEGLEPIRGNILNSTPGEPSTYDSFGTTGFTQIGKDQAVTTAEGSNTSVGGTKTKEQTHTFNYSYEFEAKAGIGAGGVTVGILAGFGANAGGGYGTSTSQSYTATVDNLPSDASGYSFSWRFGTREATLNGNPVLILEYQLDNVHQLPSAPRNLRVEEVTSSSVTLGWDAVPGAGSYEVYQISTTGKKYLRETVPGTATSYTDTNVTPNTGYTYCIRNVAKSGARSIYSTQVQASTLTDSDGKFVIEQQPGNDDIVSTYVGGTATATVQAKYLDEEGQEKTLWYYWEKYNTETKTWDEYQSGKNPTLTISDVTEDMDGDKYRCQVFYASNLYLYTEPVTLKIGKANSTTTLSSDQANQTVNASYVKTEEVETEETKTVPVKKTVGGAEYTEYKADSITVYLGGNGTYYSITGETATPLSQESKNVQLTYTVAEALKTISFGQLTKDTTFNGTTSPVTYEYQDEGSATEKTTYTANQKYTYAADSSVEVYNRHTDANGSTPASDFWFVKIGDQKYAADVETAIQLNINDSTHVDVNDLVQSTTEEKVTKIQQTTVSGEEVNLTATVNDANTQAAGPTGKVVFKIVNSVGDGSGTVTGTITNGVATATWKPSVAGVYTITAAYEGSEKHMGSASAGSITINVVVPGEKKLVIDSPNSMTYGDAAIHLKAMLLSGAKDSTGASVTKLSNVTYSVTSSADANVAITNGKFSPAAAGVYTITANYTDTSSNTQLTATKTITVNKRTVTIKPSVNKDTKAKEFTLPGIANEEDKALFTLKTDSSSSGNVDISCEGITATAAGDYRITVVYTPTPDIDKKYTVVCDNSQVYQIRDDVVTVKNETDSSNGKVTLKYTVDGNTYYTISGTIADVPKGAKLIAEANPNNGYKVGQ